MKSLFSLVVLLTSLSAGAQTAASVCGSILMGDERARCIQMVAGHVVEPGAAAVCGSILMSSDKADCLRGALDKHYERDELGACHGILMGGDKANCIAGAGQVYRAAPAPGPAPSRREDDEDEDEDDDARTVRLTNYHAGTISKFFWKRPADRKFHEIKLRNEVITTNHYEDFSIPNEALTVCLQTPDGFRLYWQKVKRAVRALDVIAAEPNWAKGKCRDL